MKVFKKVFALVVALTAIAAASTAMAANATYDENTKTVSLTAEDCAAIAEKSGQVAIAVIADDMGVNSDAVFYINQGTGAEVAAYAASMGLKGSNGLGAAPANYQVRVAGANDNEWSVYDIPAAVVEPEFVQTTIDEADGSGNKRIGFAGEVTVSGSSISKIIFNAISSEDGAKAIEWTEGLAEINFNSAVTFGLEIANVPSTVTITLDSVVAE